MVSGWIDNVLSGGLTVSLRAIADFIVGGITSGGITSGDIQKGLDALFQRLPSERKATGFYYAGYIFEPSYHQCYFPSVGGHPNLFAEDDPPQYRIHKWQNPNNYTATGPPTATDDITKGYDIGSWWLIPTSPGLYICTKSTAGQATWFKVK